MDTAEILKEIGIDVWRLRRRPAAVVSAQKAEREIVVSEPREPALAGEFPVDAIRPPVESVQTPLEAPEEVAPFTVLSLAREDALLLMQPSDLKHARRFGADLLAAITGVWGGQSSSLLFEWPQPGISRSAPAMAKALGAFVDKQISDAGDGHVLIDAGVVDRLGSLPIGDRWHVIPSIDRLMTDGNLKRSVWQEILRRSAT